MNDLISRAAAITEIMADLNDRSLHDDPGTPEDYAEGYDEGIRNAAAIVLQMLSAQPVAKDINVPAKDCISRRAVIDELEERLRANGYSNVALVSELNRCIGYIMQLPSAQPETAKRIVGKSKDGMTLWYQCDMCNEPVDAQDAFCRGCGRRLTDG